ncbi:MAG: hypothetical protein EP348_01370 [Alphaproteobacteria bacterium]|nr:MAG: hypothetical protein EP348_01370 [Alphaproteobacteria bacterium]
MISEPAIEHILLAMGVSFTAFLSTSMDNVVLLVTLSLHRKYGAWTVSAGYFVAVVAMMVISLIVAQGVQLLPEDYIPLVGLVPLSVGLYELYHLIRRKDTAPDFDDAPARAMRKGTLWTVALIMLTHSWDSIGVLAPLLSDTRPVLVFWMVLAILGAALLLIGLSRLVLAHPAFRDRLTRVAPKALPFLLIAIGLYILLNTPTDVS